MTLVLPASFCGDQISNSYGYTHHCGSAGNSPVTMPCVLDSDALDFESALMTDWTSDISDYDTTEESVKAPSAGLNSEKDLKRKNADEDENSNEPKKLRKDENPSPISSPEISPSPPQPQPPRFVHVTNGHHHHNSQHLPPSPLTISHSYVETKSDGTSDNEDHENEEENEEKEDVDEEEEEFLPRRRVVPQMWNSRQRWKDERKKVLKMSIGKLAEIEDPELWLLRSVLINNTIKKLHLDIRNERQAKLRHRQQRMDYFAERFQSFSAPQQELDPMTSPQSDSELSNSNFEECASPTIDDHHQQSSSRKCNSSELYDDTSCDEIFGISEDFLRVTIPDRRVSSPLPTSNPEESMDLDISEAEKPMDCTDQKLSTDCVQYSSSSSSCDTSSASLGFYRPRTTNVDSESASNVVLSNQNRRHVGSTQVGGGSQCATQFRTNRSDCGGSGDSTFPPRVPILDSVVYHSLLASLESS